MLLYSVMGHTRKRQLLILHNYQTLIHMSFNIAEEKKNKGKQRDTGIESHTPSGLIKASFPDKQRRNDSHSTRSLQTIIFRSIPPPRS